MNLPGRNHCGGHERRAFGGLEGRNGASCRNEQLRASRAGQPKKPPQRTKAHKLLTSPTSAGSHARPQPEASRMAQAQRVGREICVPELVWQTERHSLPERAGGPGCGRKFTQRSSSCGSSLSKAGWGERQIELACWRGLSLQPGACCQHPL